jgi:hypothetical protein
MCCTTLIAEEATMATTELTRAVRWEVCWPRQEEPRAEQTPLRMSWVVVTDNNGRRQLQMQWGSGRGKLTPQPDREL